MRLLKFFIVMVLLSMFMIPSVQAQDEGEGYTLNLQQLIDASKKKLEYIDQKLEEETQQKQADEYEQRLKKRQDAIKRRSEQEKLNKKSLLEPGEHPENIKVQAEPVYQEAVRLYKEGYLWAARQQFEEVEWMSPSYKRTKRYLADIRQTIDDKKAKGTLTPKNKDIKITQEQKRLKDFQQTLSNKYQEANNFYRAKFYEEAKAKFSEIEALQPNFKDTRKYLEKIDQAFIKQKAQAEQKRANEEKIQQQEAARLEMKEKKEKAKAEKAAAKVMKEEKAVEEVQPSQEVQRLKVNEEKQKKIEEQAAQRLKAKEEKEKIKAEKIQAAQRLKEERAMAKAQKVEEAKRLKEEKQRAEKTQRFQKEKIIEAVKSEKVPSEPLSKDLEKENARVEKERLAQLKTQTDAIYKEAKKFYQMKNFNSAREKFTEILRLDPNHKGAQKYLVSIDQQVQKAQKREEQKILKEQKRVDKERQQQEQQRMKKDIKEPKTISNSERAKIDQEFQGQLKEMYARAVGLYESGFYLDAQELFLEINSLQSSYEKTEKYLTQIEDHLVEDANPPTSQSPTDAVGEALDLIEKKM